MQLNKNNNLMLLAKLDIKNKLVLIFEEGMNKKKTKKNEVKKTSAKKTVFLHHYAWVAIIVDSSEKGGRNVEKCDVFSKDAFTERSRFGD